MDVNEELKFLCKFKKNWGGGGSGRGGVGWDVSLDVNEELKFLCKLKKKESFFLGGRGRVGGRGGGGGRVGLGGQGRCNREVIFFENSKKKWGVGGGRLGVRVDVNEELKFFRKFAKKKSGGGWGSGTGGVRDGGSQWM